MLAIGSLFQVHSSTSGLNAVALGYANGNAVKIRDGRAAVSVCSDPMIGSPPRL